MKYKAIIIITVLFASFTLSAQIDERIKITVQNGKYGLTYEPSPYSSDIEELVEHKFDTILYPHKYYLFDTHNWPLITRIGGKYGIILHYKVGITDSYHDSLAVLPAIYDSAYYQGGEIILIKNNKWGYLRYNTALNLGYHTHYGTSGYFYDNFYLSPIEYDMFPNENHYYYYNYYYNNLYYYFLLKKNGKYGFYGNKDNNIPCEYDTLIYRKSKDCHRFYRDGDIWFRWTSRVHVTGWGESKSKSDVKFIKAVKGDKFTFLMVELPDNDYNYNTFNYRQVLPWYSDSVDVRMARNTENTNQTSLQHLYFIITEPNKASYMIYPFDNNFDKIKMFNLDNSAFRMDSSIKYYNCEVDTLNTRYKLFSDFYYTDKEQLAALGYDAYSVWAYFNEYSGEPTIYDINKHIFILKRPDTNIAFVYRNINKYFIVPPCGTALLMICTKVLNSSKDSVIFTLYNSQTNDTIYQGIFPYNDGLSTSQLYINYPDYWDDRTVYYSSPSAKTSIDNPGLKLELYYIPDREFGELSHKFDKSRNKKYYYKLGIINTCEMKFHPNIFKFLQKKPWEIYKRDYYYDRYDLLDLRVWLHKEEYDVKP